MVINNDIDKYLSDLDDNGVDKWGLGINDICDEISKASVMNT